MDFDANHRPILLGSFALMLFGMMTGLLPLFFVGVIVFVPFALYPGAKYLMSLLSE